MQLGVRDDPHVGHREVKPYERVPVGNASPLSLGQDRTGQDRTGQHKVGQHRTEQSRAEQGRAEQGRTGQDNYITACMEHPVGGFVEIDIDANDLGTFTDSLGD